MKEIKRDVMYHEDKVDLPDVGITAIDAQIIVEDDKGKLVYMNAEWVDEVEDEILYTAAKEDLLAVRRQLRAVCDRDGANTWSDEFQTLIDEQTRIMDAALPDKVIKPYKADLEEMITKCMEDHGIESWFEDEDDDE